MLDYQVFKEQLEELFGAYPTFKLSDKQQDVWYKHLSDLPAELLELGISRTIQSKTAFPSIADIRGVIENMLTADVDDAFNEIMGKAYGFVYPKQNWDGTEELPELKSPAHKMAMERMGGARAFLELPAEQKTVNFFRYRFAQVWQNLKQEVKTRYAHGQIEARKQAEALSQGDAATLFLNGSAPQVEQGHQQALLVESAITDIIKSKSIGE